MMKLVCAAAAAVTVFALSSPAFAYSCKLVYINGVLTNVCG